MLISLCVTRFVGYCSDDGRAVFSNQSFESFGPPYQRGDVIGCGINFAQRSIFFTKNGGIVGTSLPIPDPPQLSVIQHQQCETIEAQKRDIYPAMNLGVPEDRVRVNFGCPKCYWVLSGACGIQLVSPNRDEQYEDEVLQNYSTVVPTTPQSRIEGKRKKHSPCDGGKSV